MKIGVDLGGTNIRVGLVDRSIIKLDSSPLQEKDDLDSTLKQLKSIINAVYVPEIKGIGVGVPSIVDLENGIVYDVVNIPSWEKVPLREILEKEFKVPVFINNDSNCFALGEKYFGFGKNHKTFVGVTLGTGIGSGVIIDNKLYSGYNCGAGEIGYLPYLDFDFEYYCGANFFEKIHHTSGKKTFLDAQKGDSKALALWSEFGGHLGIALRSIIYAYDPEAIIIGGAISKSYIYFEKAMRESMSKIHFPNSLSRLKIYVSQLEHVAILGAAAQVDQQQQFK